MGCSSQACMELPLFGSLKDDEVISTCNTENESSLCPTYLPNHDQCQDHSMEEVVDTSNKFATLVEDGDSRNDQCNYQRLTSPTVSSSNKKKKKQTAKKVRLTARKLRSVGESIGGYSRISGAMEEFNDCLQASELDDLRFLGFLHTWCNKRSNGCISKKLDRVLFNNDWLVKFENSEAIFLPPSISDHCPSMVKLGFQGIKKNHRFKFFNFLTDRADFLPLVERCCSSQSAFVASRSIGDNILLAQELMRNYHKDICCLRLALKVDLMKAFDMVDWGFLLETLTVFHFPSKIITWIKACLTTPKFSISINGELAGFFTGK
ncbi:hypothetical protein Ddye_013047 [Dipteronia dyeriana]|uniref:Reverse transcriptase domain-containing protein n=1 Tax=Dipteronia dyeriana TaxID=168575 RepID=A0AAD9X5E5_9ROSI|nr:hypothetical protein Ddye_013047 [Dipteronia dyeriana]